MSVLASLVQTPAVKALGWTLLHSVWEGALAALILLAILSMTRSARVRYACACLTLCGMLSGFALTFLLVAPRAQATTSPAVNAFLRTPLDFQSAASLRIPVRLEDVLPWLVPFWFAGIIVFQMRNAAGWISARRLRTRGICRSPDFWTDRLGQLCAVMRLSRTVLLLETCIADVPVVLGYLRPVILVPAGLLAGMPANQIEAILLHELAHIRRHDYLINMLQTVIEGIWFYHPAVWWISNVIRTERENCCDDMAVAASGDTHAYASALAALEQTRGAAQQLALAASGGSLMKRIYRLLEEPKAVAPAPLISAVIMAIAMVGGLAAWQAAVPTPGAQQERISPYTRWLQEDVVYLIDDRERVAFLNLKTDAERDHFIEQFWQRRDPTPGTPENEFKTEHYRRIKFANDRYTWQNVPGWKTDRGRMYVIYGPPDELESHPGNIPTETWLYHEIKGIGNQVIVEFEDKTKTGDYHMTKDPDVK